jgi:hypothetical protein
LHSNLYRVSKDSSRVKLPIQEIIFGMNYFYNENRTRDQVRSHAQKEFICKKTNKRIPTRFLLMDASFRKLLLLKKKADLSKDQNLSCELEKLKDLKNCVEKIVSGLPPKKSPIFRCV